MSCPLGTCPLCYTISCEECSVLVSCVSVLWLFIYIFGICLFIFMICPQLLHPPSYSLAIFTGGVPNIVCRNLFPFFCITSVVFVLFLSASTVLAPDVSFPFFLQRNYCLSYFDLVCSAFFSFVCLSSVFLLYPYFSVQQACPSCYPVLCSRFMLKKSNRS